MSTAPTTSDDTGLTTGALARRLGVAPTTLRSWDRRYGIGPAVRADGRHRRWRADDVAVLEAMCRLTSAGVPPAEAARAAKDGGPATGSPPTGTPPTSPPTGSPATGSPETGSPATGSPATGSLPTGTPETGSLPSGIPATGIPATGSPPAGTTSAGPPLKPVGRSRAAGALPLGGDARQECRGLARAAVRLDAPAVEDQLGEAVERHGLIVAWQEVMVPTLHAVGRKWASSGDRYVEVEHLLSWHVSTTLRRATRPLGRGERTVAPGAVMLACVPGEQHTLPLEALNAGLARLGVPARMFGAAVPAEALTAAVRRLGPAAVVLWAQSRSTASTALARHLADARWGVSGARRSPMVVLGGPGWAGRTTPGMPRPTGLNEALALLSDLRPGNG
ncbi:MerR family transcriptional regulator [Streptomyces sp. NPDC002328]|uniref:MerR family transcriptional regulator n=1 Tax=Streptomyces sp. NPDC002328 TaxID=3364642 RepID=UPI0036C741FF